MRLEVLQVRTEMADEMSSMRLMTEDRPAVTDPTAVSILTADVDPEHLHPFWD